MQRENAQLPSAHAPESGEEQLRPLIYIYDLPAIFNSRLVQYRSGTVLADA